MLFKDADFMTRSQVLESQEMSYNPYSGPYILCDLDQASFSIERG